METMDKGAPNKRRIARMIRVYEARADSGESLAAREFVAPYLSSNVGRWNRRKWLSVGEAFRARFAWRWSELYGLICAEVLLRSGPEEAKLVTRSYLGCGFNPRAIVGTTWKK